MKTYLFIFFLLPSVLFCKSQTPPVISGWTVWGGSPSTISVATRSGSDNWLKVTSSHCAHGTHQYFNTVAGTTYTIGFDLDLGNTSKVNLLVWDVSPSNTLYNLRVVSYTGSANNINQNFVAGDTRTLIQFRQDDCVNTHFFYLDNIDIWSKTTDVLVSTPLQKDYRYGFGGQEKDNEVSGKGNSYTAEYWQYDPRISRRWNIDPLTKGQPYYSPYSAFNNNPIYFIDPNGTVGMGHGDKDGKSAGNALRKKVQQNRDGDNSTAKKKTTNINPIETSLPITKKESVADETYVAPIPLDSDGKQARGEGTRNGELMNITFSLGLHLGSEVEVGNKKIGWDIDIVSKEFDLADYDANIEKTTSGVSISFGEFSFGTATEITKSMGTVMMANNVPVKCTVTEIKNSVSTGVYCVNFVLSETDIIKLGQMQKGEPTKEIDINPAEASFSFNAFLGIKVTFNLLNFKAGNY